MKDIEQRRWTVIKLYENDERPTNIFHTLRYLNVRVISSQGLSKIQAQQKT